MGEVMVEEIPFGVSMLERAGVACVDTREGRDVVRRRRDPPTSARVVAIKSEDSDGSGPVFVDDLPLMEIRFDNGKDWSVGWLSRGQARKLARVLGASLEEM
jgi:hypothetical protein